MITLIWNSDWPHIQIFIIIHHFHSEIPCHFLSDLYNFSIEESLFYFNSFFNSFHSCHFLFLSCRSSGSFATTCSTASGSCRPTTRSGSDDSSTAIATSTRSGTRSGSQSISRDEELLFVTIFLCFFGKYKSRFKLNSCLSELITADLRFYVLSFEILWEGQF